jgi:hypothetical protein
MSRTQKHYELQMSRLLRRINERWLVTFSGDI